MPRPGGVSSSVCNHLLLSLLLLLKQILLLPQEIMQRPGGVQGKQELERLTQLAPGFSKGHVVAILEIGLAIGAHQEQQQQQQQQYWW